MYEWKGKKYCTNLIDSGVRLETESTFAFSQLPNKMLTAINASLKRKKVNSVEKLKLQKELLDTN